MKKRLLVGIMVLALALLASCGGDSSEETGVPTLKIFMGGDEPLDLAMVQEELNKISSEKYGFEIDMTYTGFGDYNTKANLMVNSGEDWDLAFTCSWALDYSANSKKGAFLDMTDYLASEEFKPMYDAIDPTFWEGAKIDGRIYAVPSQKEIANMYLYRINERLLTEADFDYTKVETMADFEPFLQWVQDNYPDMVAVELRGDGRMYSGEYVAIGSSLIIDDNDTVQWQYDMPDVIEYLYTMQDFYEKDFIPADAMTASNEYVEHALSMADGQPYIAETWSNELGWDVVTHLRYDSVVTTDSTRGAMIGININSADQEEALKFLQALSVDYDYHNLLIHGIEGIHYDQISETHIEKTERGLNDYVTPPWALGNLFNSYTVGTEPEDKWIKYKEVNDSMIRSKYLGFNINTDNVKNEIAAISNAGEKYTLQLAHGMIEDVDAALIEYREELDAAGYQKIIDDYQRQINEYLATK